MHATQPAEERPREIDAWHMRRALDLAALGQGAVEPNPMVGCVVARGAEIIGEGWHGRYGGPHAEIVALAVAGRRAAGAVLYVTLEPCCHFGKTPPCTRAIVAAGIRHVVVAQLDPFSQVAGQGIAELRAAGVCVEVGVLGEEAARLNAPYFKLLQRARPWVIAKWAMTLDGKLAAPGGASRWISSTESRAIAHQLRGRVDAVLVGRGTVLADDPLLTARPSGPRQAARIVLDSQASLASDSQLVRTVRDAPVILAASVDAPMADVSRLRVAGCEVLLCPGATPEERLDWLWAELGRRRMTNVLVEGGSRLLGACFDSGAVDEVHAFVAPKIVGGAVALSQVGGQGLSDMAQAWWLEHAQIEQVAGDVYLHGRVARSANDECLNPNV